MRPCWLEAGVQVRSIPTTHGPDPRWDRALSPTLRPPPLHGNDDRVEQSLLSSEVVIRHRVTRAAREIASIPDA